MITRARTKRAERRRLIREDCVSVRPNPSQRRTDLLADTRIASWSSDGWLFQKRSLEAQYLPLVLSSLALRVRAGVTIVLFVAHKHALEKYRNMRHPVSRLAIMNRKFQTLPSLPPSRTRATEVQFRSGMSEGWRPAHTNKQAHTAFCNLLGSIGAHKWLLLPKSSERCVVELPQSMQVHESQSSTMDGRLFVDE